MRSICGSLLLKFRVENCILVLPDNFLQVLDKLFRGVLHIFENEIHKNHNDRCEITASESFLNKFYLKNYSMTIFYLPSEKQSTSPLRMILVFLLFLISSLTSVNGMQIFVKVPSGKTITLEDLSQDAGRQDQPLTANSSQ